MKRIAFSNTYFSFVQRNVYIVGLALFLALVIKRVMALILTLGNLRNAHAELQKKVRIFKGFQFSKISSDLNRLLSGGRD